MRKKKKHTEVKISIKADPVDIDKVDGRILEALEGVSNDDKCCTIVVPTDARR